MAYFGSDSGTPENPCGMTFYLGRLGTGLTPDLAFSLPSTVAVPAFPYWNVLGPDAAPSGTSPTEWGIRQARAFVARYAAHPYPARVRGRTLFATVGESPGWDVSGAPAGVARNRAVVTGLLKSLAWNGRHGPGAPFTIGLYGNIDREFGTILDAAHWTFPEPTVVWIAWYPGPLTCAEAAARFASLPDFGGYRPMLWQYHGDPDYDVTPYAGGPLDGLWHPTGPAASR